MRRRTPWLIAAILLFVGAGYLVSLASAPKAPPPRVSLPRHMDDDARTRLQRRRTLPRFVVAPSPSSPAEPDHEAPPLRDPLIAALPGTVKRAAIIVEANAIRHSPVGQLLIECLMAGEGDDLQKLKREGGLDLLEDVDRVAALDNTFVATGRFADVKWEQILKGSTSSPLNARTTLWEGHGDVAATWNQQMLIVGSDRAAITAVIDRLEGTAPAQPPVLDERDTYGEIYGVVTPSALSELLAREQPAVAQRLGTVLDRITLHVDASHDVGIVLDARGKGGDVDDLGKSVGGALALGRLAAQAQSNKDLAAILEYARVVPGHDGSGFRTELALPLTFLQEKLRDCPNRKRRGVPNER